MGQTEVVAQVVTAPFDPEAWARCGPNQTQQNLGQAIEHGKTREDQEGPALALSTSRLAWYFATHLQY